MSVIEELLKKGNLTQEQYDTVIDGELALG